MEANLSMAVTDASQVVFLGDANIATDFPIQAIPNSKDLSWPVEFGIGFRAKIKYGKDKPTKETINIFQASPRNFFMAGTDDLCVFSLTNLISMIPADFPSRRLTGKSRCSGKRNFCQRNRPCLFINSHRDRSNCTDTITQRQKSAFDSESSSRLLREVVVRDIDPSKERPYGPADYVVKSKDLMRLRKPAPNVARQSARIDHKAGSKWRMGCLYPGGATSSVSNAVK